MSGPRNTMCACSGGPTGAPGHTGRVMGMLLHHAVVVMHSILRAAGSLRLQAEMRAILDSIRIEP